MIQAAIDWFHGRRPPGAGAARAGREKRNLKRWTIRKFKHGVIFLVKAAITAALLAAFLYTTVRYYPQTDFHFWGFVVFAVLYLAVFLLLASLYRCLSIGIIRLRELVPSLLIAVFLNSIKWLQRPLQTIFFLPYVTNSIAIGMVFTAMFNIVGSFYGTENEIIVTAGIINNIIEFFGGEPVNWINYGSSYAANITVMIIYIVWNALPFKILILLGGLQSVNRQYYDAARVDGTSRRRIFTRITVPLLSPMIAYVVITGFIDGFKEYTSIIGIFGETMGPPDAAGRLNTMVGFIYDALATNNQGRASAAALILFAIILVVTLLNLQVSKKRVHF